MLYLEMDIVRIETKVLLLSILLYVLSLTQPGFSDGGGAEGNSFMLPIVGWLGLLAGSAACIAWLANPLLLISWITLKKHPKTAMLFSLMATLFALSFLFFDTVKTDEGGADHLIEAYYLGYWLWLASCVCCFGGMLVIYLRNNSKPQIQPDTTR